MENTRVKSNTVQDKTKTNRLVHFLKIVYTKIQTTTLHYINVQYIKIIKATAKHDHYSTMQNNCVYQ